MSPIAKALRRQTPAERLATGIFENPFPAVVHEYAMWMLCIAVRLQCDVPPTQLKGGAA